MAQEVKYYQRSARATSGAIVVPAFLRNTAPTPDTELSVGVATRFGGCFEQPVAATVFRCGVISMRPLKLTVTGQAHYPTVLRNEAPTPHTVLQHDMATAKPAVLMGTECFYGIGWHREPGQGAANFWIFMTRMLKR